MKIQARIPGRSGCSGHGLYNLTAFYATIETGLEANNKDFRLRENGFRETETGRSECGGIRDVERQATVNGIRVEPPEAAKRILAQLHQAGYSASLVGGCVRDSLLGKVPKDWDICTSALPEEIRTVFAGEHLVATGKKHGTMTVVLNHEPYEVTTYRVDGAYTDHRHPDAVRFVPELREDLARRDFTVNAMAYDPVCGLQDFFGGQEDLAHRVIRCVGKPEDRLTEDALRILRALRFAAVYGFTLEKETDQAVRRLYPTLSLVAAERIWQELRKLLCGQAALQILLDYPEVFAHLLPPLKPCIGFDQKNPFHSYTVYEHMVRSVDACPPDPMLRLAMLLHDCGKPSVFEVDEKGIGHARGHQAKSAELAAGVLAYLRVDAKIRDGVLEIIANHDTLITCDRKLLLRRLNRFGETRLRELFLVQRADALAKSERLRFMAEEQYQDRVAALDALLAEKPCYTLKDLAVHGAQLMEIGVKPGPEMGEVLNRLLKQVMEGSLPNDREALLSAVRKELNACER